MSRPDLVAWKRQVRDVSLPEVHHRIFGTPTRNGELRTPVPRGDRVRYLKAIHRSGSSAAGEAKTVRPRPLMDCLARIARHRHGSPPRPIG